MQFLQLKVVGIALEGVLQKQITRCTTGQVLNNFEVFWTISHHFLGISSYLGLSPAVLGYLQLSRAISRYLGLFPAISGYLGLSWAISGQAISSYLGLSQSILVYLRLLWEITELSLAIIGVSLSSIKVQVEAGESNLFFANGRHRRGRWKNEANFSFPFRFHPINLWPKKK